jgi:molecular chaperone GrpE
MTDRQELANRLLDYLQTTPELPEYLAEQPESLPAFDPYQMVGEWIALRHEIKQQNKLTQSTTLSLQQALEVERTRNEQLQNQQIGTIAKGNDDGSLCKDLLSVMDDLDRSIAHNQAQIAAIQLSKPPETSFWQKLVSRSSEPSLEASYLESLTSNQEGIEMIRRSLLAILRQRQITPIMALEQPFDPECMYAIGQQHSDSIPPNHVVQEVVRGYRQGDRILREVQAIVSIEQSA